MANTVVYPEDWAVKLQERLDHPTNWKELLDVTFANKQVKRRPYLSTTPSLQTGTRGSAYGFSDFGITSESLTINTYQPIPVFIDRADLAQSDYADIMYFADLQGQLINERLENRMLAQHASWTDFGTSTINAGGSASTQITVSLTNLDDMITAFKRVVTAANGIDVAQRNGYGIVWRPADFEILEQFMANSGFTMADATLKNGAVAGVHYLGVDHYVSNEHTANHVFATVKKTGNLGILKDTFGQIVVTQDPNLQSGVGVVSRVDYGFLWPNNYDSMYYDMNVA